MIQAAAGIILSAAGLTLTRGFLPAFAFAAYPFLWWGLLLLADWLNFTRFGRSPMRSRPGRFFGIIVPLSVLYWLGFELLNLYFNQWRYAGVPEDTLWRMALVFTSFATVIPIIVEIFWLIAGPIRLAAELRAILPSRQAAKWVLAGLGIFAASLPFWAENFWVNQAAWFAPLFLFAPFLPREADDDRLPPRRLFRATIASGLAAGFLWEFLNFWAAAKWKYMVLPDMPRLFEMPILGYAGFIPFAAGTLVLYLWARRMQRAETAVSLYVAALFATWLFARNIPLV